jgi:hypothetical protein
MAPATTAVITVEMPLRAIFDLSGKSPESRAKEDVTYAKKHEKRALV